MAFKDTPKGEWIKHIPTCGIATEMWINYTMTTSIPSEAAVVVTEYLELLSWHGMAWYMGWSYWWWWWDCARGRDIACVKWCLKGMRLGERLREFPYRLLTCREVGHQKCAHLVGNLSFTLHARKGGSFYSFVIRSSPNGILGWSTVSICLSFQKLFLLLLSHCKNKNTHINWESTKCDV